MQATEGDCFPALMESFKSFSAGGGEKCRNPFRSKEACAVVCCSAFFIVSYFASSSPSFHEAFLPAGIRSLIFGSSDRDSDIVPHVDNVKEVFDNASMPDGTVIITTLNGAWAENNTMIDIFLESFQHGYGTQRLLQHLIIVCVDQKAYLRCLAIHPHCLKVKTGGVDFSGEQSLLSHDYIKMIWRRIKFLETVLEMNHSFVFTDADVVWLRDPFPQLQHDLQADMQMACDRFNGRPWDLRNKPNAGFLYVRANERTLSFYRYWYSQRNRSSEMADQEVFNEIKFEGIFKSIGIRLRFLDTQYFGGFCGIRFTDMTKAFTMHATCCKGLIAKLNDLRAILDGWKEWQQKPHLGAPAVAPKVIQHRSRGGRRAEAAENGGNDASFKVPQSCQRSMRTK